MSLRSRLAAAPVSSSASTTMPPLTRCSESANRSIEETSDFRQHVLVTAVLARSAFTCAVIAMRATLVRSRDACIRTGKFLGMVLTRDVVAGDVREDEPRTDLVDGSLEGGDVRHRRRVCEDRVDLQVRRGAV